MSGDSSDIREPHLRHGDFLGAFGVLRREGRFLMARNRRVIGGREVDTWDLPGGQVEPGERLLEALARELREETTLVLGGAPALLFVQEGERVVAGARCYAWRSFFFAVGEWKGAPRPADDVEELRWMDPDELRAGLHAPYHDSFLQWLERGGAFFQSHWED